MFVIEDEIHAEMQGQYATLDEAIAELKRCALLPWDELPNVAPCTSWESCGRNYDVIEYDTTVKPWHELRRLPVLSISAAGVSWEAGFNDE